MPRSTTADLRTKLRLLIQDPAGASQSFSEDELEDLLDANRREVRYMTLHAEPTIAPGGVVTYQDFYSFEENWEDGAAIVDPAYADLSASATFDARLGKWTFATHQGPPLRASGFIFDIYGAAADALEIVMSGAKGNYTFSADGQYFDRNAAFRQLEKMAALFRSRARVLSGPFATPGLTP